MSAINTATNQPISATAAPVAATNSTNQKSGAEQASNDVLNNIEKFLPVNDVESLKFVNKVFKRTSETDTVWKQLASGMELILSGTKEATGKQHTAAANEKTVREQVIATVMAINKQALTVLPESAAKRISAIKDPFLARQAIEKENFNVFDKDDKYQHTALDKLLYDYLCSLRFKEKLTDIEIQTFKFLVNSGIMKPAYDQNKKHLLYTFLINICGSGISEPTFPHPELLSILLNEFKKSEVVLDDERIPRLFYFMSEQFWKNPEKYRECINLLLDAGIFPTQNSIKIVMRSFFLDCPLHEQRALQSLFNKTKGLNKEELLKEIATYENLMPNIVRLKRGSKIIDCIFKHFEKNNRKIQVDPKETSVEARFRNFIGFAITDWQFPEEYLNVDAQLTHYMSWDARIHAVFDNHPDDETLRNAIKTAFALSDEESGAILNQAGTVEKHTQETQIGYEKVKQLVNALPEPVPTPAEDNNAG